MNLENPGGLCDAAALSGASRRFVGEIDHEDIVNRESLIIILLLSAAEHQRQN